MATLNELGLGFSPRLGSQAVPCARLAENSHKEFISRHLVESFSGNSTRLRQTLRPVRIFRRASVTHLSSTEETVAHYENVVTNSYNRYYRYICQNIFIDARRVPTCPRYTSVDGTGVAKLSTRTMNSTTMSLMATS